ncbi:MAG TPA: hypothetical protein VIH55_07465 [Acidimicrobiia bacterium]
MSLFNQPSQSEISADAATIDPFDDPVSYLAGLGLEAELIEVRSHLPEAA